MRIYLFFQLLLLIDVNQSAGQMQSSASDSPNSKNASLEKIYKDFDVANILSGRIYPINYPKVKGSQYHTGDYLMPGDLIY